MHECILICISTKLCQLIINYQNSFFTSFRSYLVVFVQSEIWTYQKAYWKNNVYTFVTQLLLIIYTYELILSIYFAELLEFDEIHCKCFCNGKTPF